MKRFAWPLFALAFLLAATGVIFGTAAAVDYGWVLRWWLALTSASAVIFMALINRGARAVKIASAIALALTAVAGIDPAYRLLWIGFPAP